MDISSEIALRPRFVLILQAEQNDILSAFDQAKTEQSNLKITRLDDHVFIKFPKVKQELFTPQLHLELIPQENQSQHLHALIGPSPGLWTLFMFIHFVIAICFLVFGVWLYSNIRTHQEIAIPIFFMILMVFLWFGLYIIGRLGRKSSLNETKTLLNFLQDILNANEIRYTIKN